MRAVVMGASSLVNPAARWTKQGSGSGPEIAVQGIGLPSASATEVNVPHSWATTPAAGGRVADPKTTAASASAAMSLDTSMRNPPFDWLTVGQTPRSAAGPQTGLWPGGTWASRAGL